MILMKGSEVWTLSGDRGRVHPRASLALSLSMRNCWANEPIGTASHKFFGLFMLATTLKDQLVPARSPSSVISYNESVIGSQ
jgi:hypothetical protein